MLPGEPRVLDTLNDALSMYRGSRCSSRPLLTRNSPEDAEVLEAEYAANTRPSSATRMRIASQVSLDKKAIDTWFQNRRKKDRGLDSSGESSCPGSSLPSDAIEPPSSQEDNDIGEQVLALTPVDASNDKTNITTEAVSEPLSDTVKSESSSNDEKLANDSKLNRHSLPSLKRSATWSVSTVNHGNQESTGLLSWDLASSQSTGYLADRLASSQRQEEESSSQVSVTAIVSTSETVTATRTFGRSHSLRISTDEHGNACVVDRSVPSPTSSRPSTASQADGFLNSSSPHHPPSVNSINHYRTSSGTNFVRTISNQNQPHSPALLPSILPPSSAPSSVRQFARNSRQPRSHDSRLWESCADKSAGQELSKLAESESTGSAKDAIEAMRSSAASQSSARLGRRALGIVSGNADSLRAGNAAIKRPQVLRRAGTFAGRSNVQMNIMPADLGLKKPSLKKSTSAVFEIHEDSESDKENRDPMGVRVHQSSFRIQAAAMSGPHDTGRSQSKAVPRNQNGKRQRADLAAEERGQKRRQSLEGNAEDKERDSGDETMLIVAGLLQLKNGQSWQARV
jgi:Homeodomain